MPIRDFKVILSKTLNDIKKKMINENMRKLAMIYDKNGNILKYKPNRRINKIPIQKGGIAKPISPTDLIKWSVYELTFIDDM